MNKLKLILTLALTFVVLFAQAGHAAAAPLAQTATTSITGTVTVIALETDSNGVTTAVLVTLVDDQNVTQTVRISVETANTLQLLDSAGEPVPVNGQIVTIDSTLVIPDTTTTEEPVNPISALLAGFFDENASVIDGYHNDGFGFGVIAQALWMSRNLTGTEDVAGDASLAEEILKAKQDKDFESFFENHPEIIIDGAVPTNWGQFRKVVLDKKNNLGVIVSGHSDETNAPVQSENANGNGQGNGQGNGNGKNNGNGNNGNGHGQGNGNGNGNGNSKKP